MFGAVHLVDGAQRHAVRSRKAQALLARCALADRPVRREALAHLLWSGGGRRNLRQLLYQLRQLPEAEAWLHVDEDSVHIQLDSDGGDLLRGRYVAVDPGVVPLDSIDDIGTEAFADWVDQTREQLDDARRETALRQASELLDTDPDGGRELIETLLQSYPDDLSVGAVAIRARRAAGDTDGARALWTRLAPRVTDLSPRQQAVWREVQLELSPSARPGLSALVPRLRALLDLEPAPLAPTLAAKVLGVELIELATAWAAAEADDSSLDDGTALALRARLAEVLESEGELARAAEHFLRLGDTRRAFELMWRAGLEHEDLDAWARAAEVGAQVDPERADEAASLAAVGFRLRRDLARATEVVEALRQRAMNSQRRPTLARARLHQAYLALVQADGDGARFATEQLDQLAREATELQPFADLIHGVTAAMSRDPARALPLLAAGQSAGRIERLQALIAAGACHGMAGNLGEARAAHEGALALARELGARSAAIAALLGLSSTAEREDDLPRARRHLLELRALEVDSSSVHLALHNLATIDLSLGHLGEARELLSEALMRSDDDGLKALVFRTRGELELRVGRFAEAVAWAERSCDQFQRLGRERDALLTAFNAKLAEWYEAPSAKRLERAREAAAPLLVDQDHWGALVARDLVLIESDKGQLDRLLPYLHLAPGIHRDLALFRYEVLHGEPAIDGVLKQRILDDTGLIGIWGRTLLRHYDPDAPSDLDAQLATQVEAMGRGLLSSQRESLAGSVDKWLADPITAPGPF